MNFGPANAKEAEIFAVEGFRVRVQHRLQTLMTEQGMTQKDLAEKMGVSTSRISQIFSDRCNIGIKNLAKIFHALDAECMLSAQWINQPPAKMAKVYHMSDYIDRSPSGDNHLAAILKAA
jgi:transcriptional regulator with XRE-family HTH domain